MNSDTFEVDELKLNIKVFIKKLQLSAKYQLSMWNRLLIQNDPITKVYK